MAKTETWRPVRASRLSFELKDPPTHRRAVREIGWAIDKADADIPIAADILGVSERQLRRWVSEHELLSRHLARARERVPEPEEKPDEE